MQGIIPAHLAPSPSGKAPDSDSGIRRFESFRGCQIQKTRSLIWSFFVCTTQANATPQQHRWAASAASSFPYRTQPGLRHLATAGIAARTGRPAPPSTLVPASRHCRKGDHWRRKAKARLAPGFCVSQSRPPKQPGQPPAINAWRTGWRDVPCADRPSCARLHGRHGS